jgi:hypothetical protein
VDNSASRACPIRGVKGSAAPVDSIPVHKRVPENSKPQGYPVQKILAGAPAPCGGASRLHSGMVLTPHLAIRAGLLALLVGIESSLSRVAENRLRPGAAQEQSARERRDGGVPMIRGAETAEPHLRPRGLVSGFPAQLEQTGDVRLGERAPQRTRPRWQGRDWAGSLRAQASLSRLKC